ncbi:MAG TPA: hypothetical protein VK974_02390 [Methylophilaceae bacterium]|nr:hypothetical protein [Methylophilaceae bacterium]
MRKFILLIGSTMVWGFSNLTLADTITDDSTNTYAPSKQYNEKLHQKPVAEDANSGSDMSTTKEKTTTHKKHKSSKKNTDSSSDASTTKTQ